MAQSSMTRTAVALLLVAVVVVAAASVPAATAYGCYDDCYERCANGKDDPACTSMCNQACGTVDKAVGALAGAAKQGEAAIQQGLGADAAAPTA